MPPRIYEVRVYYQGRNRAEGDPFLTSIDLNDAEGTADLLNRHLLGAVDRLGGERRHAHLYHLEIHEIDSNGKGRGQPLWRWAAPTRAGA